MFTYTIKDVVALVGLAICLLLLIIIGIYLGVLHIICAIEARINKKKEK